MISLFRGSVDLSIVQDTTWFTPKVNKKHGYNLLICEDKIEPSGSQEDHRVVITVGVRQTKQTIQVRVIKIRALLLEEKEWGFKNRKVPDQLAVKASTEPYTAVSVCRLQLQVMQISIIGP